MPVRKKIQFETQDESFSVTGEISKSDDEQRIVFGWAYVSHDKNGNQIVDKSGEFVSDPEEMENAAYTFMLNSRRGEDTHGVFSKDAPAPPRKADVIESTFFSKEKRDAMGIPDGILPESAWWIGVKIHDDELWKAYKSGDRKMFSIHGSAKTRKVA